MSAQTAPTRSSGGAMAIGAVTHIVVSLPVFLTGALAVQISDELRFASVGLGAAVAAYHGAGAVTSVFLGRLVDRFGAIWSLRAGVVGAVCASLGISLTARTWASLAVWLAVGGLCRAIVLPAANRLLVSRVTPGRLGTAFGLKQTAAPIATMLAGFAVPVLALTLGWRSAYLITAIMAFVVLFVLGKPADRQQRAARRADAGPPPQVPVGLLLSTLALGFVAHTALLGFTVDATVAAGASPGVAGTVLAAAGVSTIVVRLAAGVACDRTGIDPFRLSAGMLLAGSGGIVLLATGVPGAMAVGAIVGLAGAWGFPGVFWFAVMTTYPGAPGRVTGALAPGSLGGVIGPLVFGLVVSRAGYSLAWLFAAAAAAGGATTILLAGRRLRALRATALDA